MQPRTNNLILIAFLIAGLFITQACAQQGFDSYYKSSSIENNGDPTSVTNTVESPAEMQVGDVYSATFNENESAIIDFSGVDSSAHFILAISAIDTSMTSKTVQLGSTSAAIEASVVKAVSTGEIWKAMGAAEALDQQLRGSEEILANQSAEAPEFFASASKSMIIDKSVSVGDSDSFKVLNSLSSLSSFATIDATVKCVTENTVFFIDDEALANRDLSDDDIEELCTNFEAAVVKEFELFGEPSDKNGDGKIAVLMTPQVNRLGAMGGGIITGFFYANDLYNGENSNMREIIYTMVPDSLGRYGATIPKYFAMSNLLPAVLPHELQHAISYNQKVFVNRTSPEENWLNEGLSHLSEDLLGYGQENPSRVEIYLSDPASYGPISLGSPSLAERGAAYLFMRFLYEQAADPDRFIKDLLQSGLTGTANVEAAFAGESADFDQIGEFLLRWSAAVAMSSFNISSDPRFSYAERSVNEETGNYHGICLSCEAHDGRGTILSGVELSNYWGVSQFQIEPSAAKFHKLTSLPIDLELSAVSGGEYGLALVRYE